ncbi:hypothetical protein AB0H83_12320 [Dactylosporangium sp. NPDC050688]|uniref:hypothetical protein n=1 Tax=Dactylosporangium sp. NPDC050688 TaxID=3157217 RepID=UPI003401F904
MSPHRWQLPPLDDDRPTIAAHALALAALHGPGPWPDGGAPVPGTSSSRSRPHAKDRRPDPAPLISDTVMDGIRTHHLAAGDAPAPTVLPDLLEHVLRVPPSAEEFRRLRDAAAQPRHPADTLARRLRGRDLPADRLREVAVRLAGHGTRRQEVATGIALLGIGGDRRDRELLLLLGTLEDLTLVAAGALHRSQPDPDRAVYDLARRVEGWGRIDAVHHLRGTTDPEIRGWLLREGYRNTVMDEYLAHLAATTGDLRAALAPGSIDEPLLAGAGGILLALCTGGPSADITHYGDGPHVIDRYLVHAGNHPPNLGRVGVVGTLRRFIAGETVWSGAGPRADAMPLVSGGAGQARRRLRRPDRQDGLARPRPPCAAQRRSRRLPAGGVGR